MGQVFDGRILVCTLFKKGESDEDSDEFFEGLDDEGEKDIFDSDLANDNMDNDDDIIE